MYFYEENLIRGIFLEEISHVELVQTHYETDHFTIMRTTLLTNKERKLLAYYEI